MRTSKLMFISALLTCAVLTAKAQLPSSINEVSIFKTKFSKDKVWDVQRNPAYAVAGQDWQLTGLNIARDANGSAVSWAAGRYLLLVPEIDNTNSSNSLIDDVYNKGARYTISLKLYESSGKFVELVSKWGRISGVGSHGFMYEVEGNYGSFFSENPLNSSSVISYKPNYAVITKLSELLKDTEGVKQQKVPVVQNRANQTNLAKGRKGTAQRDISKVEENPIQVVETAQPQIAVGYYTLTARCSGKVLDVLDASTQNGAKIQQWELNGNIAQHWKIEPVQGAPGYYILTARCSGKVLDVLDASKNDGAKIQQWQLNGNIAQHWKIEPVQGAPGYFILTARCSGKVLDVLDARKNDGAEIQQWQLNGNIAQHWKLDIVK